MRSKHQGKVSFAWNHAVDEVLGDDAGVTGVRLRSVQGNASRTLEVDGVFIAVGHHPNTQLFENQLDMRGGYIVTKGGLNGDCDLHQCAGRVCSG